MMVRASDFYQFRGPGMIPRWQWAGIIILALLALAAGICSSPHSYAYAFLSGQCSHEPVPQACHPRSRYGR
jgi:hypothetical protein